jgi:putative PIN family toxin of toxin-antitoxin system
MTRVVIDTNVVVSANLVDEGPSARIFDLAVNRKLIEMCVSPAVLAEYEKVLRRPRFQFTAAKIDDTLKLIHAVARLVHPTKTLKISKDESDNRFYECAEEAKANYLVTGNTADFQHPHGSTKIMTPREFVEQVVPKFCKANWKVFNLSLPCFATRTGSELPRMPIPVPGDRHPLPP